MLFLTLFGCATDRDAYKRTLNLAFEELEERVESKRTIASKEDQLSISKLKPTTMLLFPKIYSGNLKRSEEKPINYRELNKMGKNEIKSFFQAREEYYQPVEFKINPLIKTSCKKLAKNYKVFLQGRNLKNENCLVIEVKKVMPKFFGKWISEIRRDDLLKVHLIMSENLRPFGKRVYLATQMGKKLYRTVDVVLDDKMNMSSELDFIPIDLPNPANFKIKKGKKFVATGLMRIPQDIFLVTKIKSQIKTPFCQNGDQVDYRDNYGNLVNIDWCKGGYWPNIINNSKFFAIKK
ncbi:MAG: hypothetical protein DRQ88_10310 [Epsilonproteobacteria bacterium]|nr:MAG: hypothetical protein DRQ88_10310 [Campylobacterota bacterium]RLA65367.1 MAG: hypothetical protein DRQ89_01210 [Campylobacterota bacterium]